VQKFDYAPEQQAIVFFVIVFMVTSLVTYAYILYEEKGLWRYRIASSFLAASFGALLTLVLAQSILTPLANFMVAEYSNLFGQLNFNSVLVLVIMILGVFLVFFFLLYAYVTNRLLKLLNWTPISESDFGKHASKILVKWTHNFEGTGAEFRQVRITSEFEYRSSLLNAYLPWYHDSKGKNCNYDDPEAVNFTVREWVKKRQVARIENPQSQVVVVTAYDAYLGKRLVVDGSNRCVAVAKYGFAKNKIADILLVEAYGGTVRQVFKADFQNVERLSGKGNPGLY